MKDALHLVSMQIFQGKRRCSCLLCFLGCVETIWGNWIKSNSNWQQFFLTLCLDLVWRNELIDPGTVNVEFPDIMFWLAPWFGVVPTFRVDICLGSHLLDTFDVLSNIACMHQPIFLKVCNSLMNVCFPVSQPSKSCWWIPHPDRLNWDGITNNYAECGSPSTIGPLIFRYPYPVWNFHIAQLSWINPLKSRPKQRIALED